MATKQELRARIAALEAEVARLKEPQFIASAGEIAALQFRFGEDIAKHFTTKLTAG